MGLMDNRTGENWDWFIRPVDIILGDLYVGELGTARSHVGEWLDAIGESWVSASVWVGTFFLTLAPHLEDDEKIECFELAVEIVKQPEGVDGQLFDCIAGLRWMFDYTEGSEVAGPPTEDPMLLFLGYFSLIMGLLKVAPPLENATPAETMVVVFEHIAQLYARENPALVKELDDLLARANSLGAG